MDKVWNGKQCVSRAMCTCQEGNVTYTNGQSWDVGSCMKCHCVEGREQCSEICKLTEEDCKKQGKKLLNKDLKDSVCCRCASEEPHCLYKNEEKAIGAEWHEGLCNTYKCAKTSDGIGMIMMTKTECAACGPNEEKEFVANKCCPICRKKATPPDTPKTPTPPKKDTEKCAEIMETPTAMADKRITLEPAHKGTPHDLQPSGKGWSVKESDKPVIVLDLSTDHGKRPGVLQQLAVLGNVKEVTIKYTAVRPRHGVAEVFEDYNQGKPLNVEGKEITLHGVDVTHEGITVFKVKVTVVKAVKPEEPIDAKLKVHACVEDAPEPCDETHLEEFVCLEIMKTPKELADHRITLHPATSGTPSDLRPQGKGWSVKVTDSPSVTVNIASHDGTKPGLIEKIGVLGNVKTVSIKYRAVRPNEHHHAASTVDHEGFQDYKQGKPIDVEKGEIMLSNEFTKKAGVIAYEVRITPLAPVVKGNAYDMKLHIYACIQVEYDAVVEPEPENTPEPNEEHPEDHPHDHKHPHSHIHPHPDDHSHPEDHPLKHSTGCVKIMENGELPEHRITLSPSDKGTPSDLHPKGKGWSVPLEDKPTVTMNLASPDNRHPGLLEKITFGGNVKTVLIKVQHIRPRHMRNIEPTKHVDHEGFADFNDGKPVDVEHVPVLFEDHHTKKPGMVVYTVHVTVVSVVHPNKPIDLTMDVVACLQDKHHPHDEHHPDSKHPHDEHHPHDEPHDNKPHETGCVDIMDQPDELPDKKITLHPADKGTPTDLRPSGKGWPVKSEDKPVIVVNLANHDDRKPGLLNKIHVHGNVKTVTVEYRPIRPRNNRHIEPTEHLNPEGFKPLNEGKPIDVEHGIVFKDPVTKQPGIMVYEVRITLVEPIKPHEPFNAKLKVHACIQDDLEFISVEEAKELLHFAEGELKQKSS